MYIPAWFLVGILIFLFLTVKLPDWVDEVIKYAVILIVGALVLLAVWTIPVLQYSVGAIVLVLGSYMLVKDMQRTIKTFTFTENQKIFIWLMFWLLIISIAIVFFYILLNYRTS